MTIHIGAQPGEVAETVLLPGDPLRAKHVAENLLENAVCYNEIRGMYGYTGEYKGKRVSIQGTGMGVPSISIYAQELIEGYGVKNLIRVGTCGSIQPHLNLRDVILVMAASTDSQINRFRFNGDFAPAASFKLLKKAYDAAEARNVPVTVGTVLTLDLFYHEEPDYFEQWARYGILALEMESAALFTLAARFGVDAFTLLTVSDDLLNEKASTPEERQTSFLEMMEIALETAE